MPTHDQALQQIVLLKRELAELRAGQALSEQKVILQTPAFRTAQTRNVNTSNGIAQSESRNSQETWTSSTVDSSSKSEQGLPLINKSLENKHKLTAVLKEQTYTSKSSTRSSQIGDSGRSESARVAAGPSVAWMESTKYTPQNEDYSPEHSVFVTDIQAESRLAPSPPHVPRTTARPMSSRTQEHSPRLRGQEVNTAAASSENSVMTNGWMDKKAVAEVDLERSAHIETYKTLDLSEETVSCIIFY